MGDITMRQEVFMTNERIVSLAIIYFALLFLFLHFFGIYKVEKETAIRVLAHNRAVRLGLYQNNQSTNSKDDCFHSEKFLKQSDCGNLEVNYLKDCEYRQLLPYTKEDLFLNYYDTLM